jgi:hypothetical protein
MLRLRIANLWAAICPAPRWHRIILAVFLVVATVSGIQISSASPAQAQGAYLLLGEGLDSCAAPSIAQMEDYWTDSPYYYWGIYIGGDERSCSQPNLTKGWINDVMSGSASYDYMAWQLLPLWAGPQDPCESGFGNYISTNTTTAYDQGVEQAGDAYDAWVGLGQSSNTPIVYDMEFTGNTITSTCLAAIKSFISGWDDELGVAPAQKSGVYTSSDAGDLNDFASIAHVPNFIYGAYYDGDPSVNDMEGVASNHWVDQQRHKQYLDNNYEPSPNGKADLLVDNDCANSWTYAQYSVQNTSEGCT